MILFALLRLATSTAPTSVTISTYAWMEDVELMGPTQTLALQGDEYSGDGQISGPASAVSKVAGLLKDVPVIGPFARATQFAADAVGGIARIFGFCNPPVIEDVRGFIPMNGPMIASSQISTAVQKFSLDPKQELCIDPRLHGLDGTDELAIKNFVSRESYVGYFNWASSDTVGTKVFNVRVNPNQGRPENYTTWFRVFHTPGSYLSHMFDNWRGDLIFRIKVVATKFHKGRLKLCFDPVTDLNLLDPQENAVYTHILDIGENDDVEIRVPYHQATSWLNTTTAMVAGMANGGTVPLRSGEDNGMFTVSVQTKLVSPDAGASVNVLLFVRCADNFEFANPRSHIGGDTTCRTPNFYTIQGKEVTSLDTMSAQFGDPVPDNIHAYDMNFGEKIVSLRDVIHRAVLCDTPLTILSSSGNTSIVKKTFKHMPYLPGYQPTAFPTNANQTIGTGLTAPYAWTNMPHIAYVTLPFLGFRGSVNYYITAGEGSPVITQSNCWVERITEASDITTTNRYLSSSAILATSTDSAIQRWKLTNAGNDCLAGGALYAPRTNSTIAVNVPDYKRFNFSLVRPSNFMLGTSIDGTDKQGAAFYYFNQNGAIQFSMRNHVSAGVDFTPLFFLCCPSLDYLVNNPGVV